MIRISAPPNNDGLQQSTERWAMSVSDALTGIYGSTRTNTYTGFSKEPTYQKVVGNGNIATIYFKFPAGTVVTNGNFEFLEVVTRTQSIARTSLWGTLLVTDLLDMSIEGIPVEDGLAVLASKTYSQGFTVAGSLTLMEG